MGDEALEILREIRDIQREHLAAYKLAAERSIALQTTGVTRQEKFGVLYRRVLAVLAVVILVLLGFVVYIVVRAG